MLLNIAIPPTIGTVIGEYIEKEKVSPTKPFDEQTVPLFKVKVNELGATSDTSTKNDTLAFEEITERGKYPTFFAKETTFSLNVAESKNTSLLNMFAL
jgi:hypothetical protein